VTEEERPPASLADSLSSWTPPWERDEPRRVEPPAPPPEPEPLPEPEPEPEPRGAAEPEPVPEPLPEAELLPGPGPELEDVAVLRGALEAILLVVDEPVPEIVLAQVLERPTGVVSAALAALVEEYDRDRRGFELRQAAGGWRLYTRDAFAPYVERFVLDGQQVRLTQAALETLAVIAYKQPVTRSRVSGIRGVNCDGVIRTLLTRGLIDECGTEPDTGAHLYRTTTLFLERMGINSVDELPALAPFLPDDLPEEI
jgi:segregation and condensation protein B